MVLDKSVKRAKGTKEETVTLRLVSRSNQQANAAEKDRQELHRPDRLDALVGVHGECLTPELSDAGGPARPHWQLRSHVRIRSSDFG